MLFLAKIFGSACNYLNNQRKISMPFNDLATDYSYTVENSTSLNLLRSSVVRVSISLFMYVNINLKLVHTACQDSCGKASLEVFQVSTCIFIIYVVQLLPVTVL